MKRERAQAVDSCVLRRRAELTHAGRATSSVAIGLAAFLLFPACAALESVGDQMQATRLDEQARAHYREGESTEAIPLAERALALREHALGPEHPDVAASLELLGNLYRDTSDHGRAEPLLVRSLAIREKALGQENLATGESHWALAKLYYYTGRLTQAKDHYMGAFVSWERGFGATHWKLGMLHRHIALIYEISGDFDSAESHLKRSFRIDADHWGPRSIAYAADLEQKGWILMGRGHYDRAEPFFTRALAIRRKLDPLNAWIPSAFNALGAYYLAKADYDRAEEMYRRGVTIREEIRAEWQYDRGVTIPEQITGSERLAASHSGLAKLELKRGQLGAAQEDCESILERDEAEFGSGSAWVANVQANLADVLRAKHEYQRAEGLYRSALAAWEDMIGPDYPPVARLRCDLARVLLDQEAVEGRVEAQSLLEHAIRTQEERLRADHPDLAESLSEMARLRAARGEYSQALALGERALAIREHAFGAEHPEVAKSICGLASIQGLRRDYAESEQLYTRCIFIREATLGPRHPEVASARLDLGQLRNRHLRADQ